MPLPIRRVVLRPAVIVLGLLVLSLANPHGLRKALRNEREVERLERENAALEQRVMQLRREAKALQGDPAAVERAAREELGYVRPGELVYKLDEVAP